MMTEYAEVAQRFADQVADRDAMLRGIAHHRVIEFPLPATAAVPPDQTAPAHAASAG